MHRVATPHSTTDNVLAWTSASAHPSTHLELACILHVILQILRADLFEGMQRGLSCQAGAGAGQGQCDRREGGGRRITTGGTNRRARHLTYPACTARSCPYPCLPASPLHSLARALHILQPFPPLCLPHPCLLLLLLSVPILPLPLRPQVYSSTCLPPPPASPGL